MSWAVDLKNGVHRARSKGGEGPILDMVEQALQIFVVFGVEGHADLKKRLDRRDSPRWGRRKRDSEFDR